MSITLSLSPRVDKKLQKSEIQIRFCGGHSLRLRARSGIYIKPQFWDTENGKIKNPPKLLRKDEGRSIMVASKQITELCNKIDTEFAKADIKDVNKEWIDKIIYDYHHPIEVLISEGDFFATFDRFTKLEGNFTEKRAKEWSDSTKKKFTTLKNHLMDFDPDLSYDQLTMDKLSSFVDFLQNEKQLIDSTLKKYIVYLKWFLRWAVKMDYCKNTDFELFDTGLQSSQTKVIYLTKEELKRVKNHDFSGNPALERVRDIYVFCCNTGLRYSDVYELKKQDIENGWIKIHTKKTKDSLQIPLNKTAKAILDKYSGVMKDKDKVLPVISIQKMNDALDIMAQECEINTPIEIIYYKKGKRCSVTKSKYELIRTHTARKTFVCSELREGVTPTTVMKMTGHKNYHSMRPYIDVENPETQNAVNLIDDE